MPFWTKAIGGFALVPDRQAPPCTHTRSGRLRYAGWQIEIERQVFAVNCRVDDVLVDAAACAWAVQGRSNAHAAERRIIASD